MIMKLVNGYELKVYLSRQEKRTGISSQKYGELDKHILLWDFDNSKIYDVWLILTQMQTKYALPRILILESSKNKYHAYCFALKTFRETIHILSDTPNIDMNYLKLGIIRGYFTLRISPKSDNVKFKGIMILESKIADDVSLFNMTINEYVTSNRR